MVVFFFLPSCLETWCFAMSLAVIHQPGEQVFEMKMFLFRWVLDVGSLVLGHLTAGDCALTANSSARQYELDWWPIWWILLSGHPLVSDGCHVVSASDPDSAALPSGADPNHDPQRLPADAAATEADPGTARVCPRCPAPQQEPSGCPALPKEEAGLHSKAGVWD